jgi:hypothetical protein
MDDFRNIGESQVKQPGLFYISLTNNTFGSSGLG